MATKKFKINSHLSDARYFLQQAENSITNIAASILDSTQIEHELTEIVNTLNQAIESVEDAKKEL